MAQMAAADQARLKRYWEEQAIKLAVQRRWAEAEKVNRSILSLDTGNVDAYNRLGKALWEQGRIGEAKAAYARALELDPGNTIASKNLQRLASLAETSVDTAIAHEEAAVPTDIFIEESGKTCIAKLLPPPGRTLATMPVPGDPARLHRAGNTIVQVLDRRGQVIGQLEAPLAQRLTRLMEGGNRYAAAVVGGEDKDVFIVIKETYQHPSLAAQVSFPAHIRDQERFRAYTKDLSLTYELEEEEEEPERLEASEPEDDVVEPDGLEELEEEEPE